MDLETQKVFLRSTFNFAISGTLNLNNEQLINMCEECSVMAASLSEINSFVVAHQTLANISYELSRFDKALRSNNILLSIIQCTGDKKGEAYTCFNLGNCYKSVGECGKAVKHYEMSLNIAREIGDKAVEGNAYGNLGCCYISLGQYDKAVKHYEMSLNFAREIGNKADEGKVYGNLGRCYYSLGQYDKAVKHYEMSLNIAREIGDKAVEGKTYSNLGNCYISLGQYDKAVKHHEMSLSIAREIGDKAGEGGMYGNLGSCYYSLGQYDKAVKHLEMSLNIVREIGDKAAEGRVYANLGNCYTSLRQHDKAIKHHEMSLNIAREIGDKETEGKANSSLSLIHYHFKQFDIAVCKLKEGLKCFEDLFQNTPQVDESKISFRDKNVFDIYRLLVAILIEQDKTSEALVYCERGRARALVDLMHFKYFLRGYEENLLDLAAVHKSVTLLESTVLYFALTQNCIYIWIIQLNGCIHFKKSFLPAQRKDQYPNEVSVPLSEQIKALISKFLPIKCEDRSLSLLYPNTDIKQNDKRRRTKLCSSSALPKAEVDENLFAKECTIKSSDKDTLVRNPFSDEEDVETSALQKLYQIVFAPVQDRIEGKEVVVVPEGWLHLVPFAALMDEHGHCVAESLRVRLFPSLTTAKMILENKLKPKEKMKPLIIGDPNTGRLPRLPCANEEARMVARHFDTEPLIGGEATKEKVLLQIENASLIHIAAHGDMERGEILLARNLTGTDSSREPNKEDNMLLMADLEQKRIKAKLVVLSCCHSARGKITSDGVVGIARAFIGAGARSVLVALWAINDGATLYFMEKFYEHLKQGKSAGKSLSDAMAAMRASGKYSAPRHWAPFVLIGDDVIIC